MTISASRGVAPDGLARHSVALLLEHQHASGSFVACPAFPVYDFAWLRDGAFCAHALDLVGETEAAARFHAWVARTVERQRPRALAAIETIVTGGTPAPGAMLPARYTLEGEPEADGADPWPNFQLDGYGTWLWALGRHLEGRSLPDELEPAVRLAADYLAVAWPLRCWNWWEELDGGEHAATLGAIAAGLAAASRLLADECYADVARAIESRLAGRFRRDGHYVRGAADARVDGSLLSLGIPFGVVAPDGAAMRATVEAVRRDLVGPTGGVRRYLGDTYYGGGEWVLLTCWLALYDELDQRRAEVERGRTWVCERAVAGELPEQETSAPQDAAMVEPWVERWGPPASPLLWSHAMFVILEATVAAGRGAASPESNLRS
ncbi:MAG TPA: glycoside hydrolase family 15 protein [Gaiellaceae bacterium]|jgi:GH15 family glucan-1,4-alpha-glucosidase